MGFILLARLCPFMIDQKIPTPVQNGNPNLKFISNNRVIPLNTIFVALQPREIMLN
jgi:hypothetical protein